MRNRVQDGKPLPNDDRYNPSNDGSQYSLMLVGTLPKDAGVYECVAKNTAGEARFVRQNEVEMIGLVHADARRG